MTVSKKLTIDYDSLISSLKMLAAADFQKVLSTLESPSTISAVIEGEIVVDDVLKAVGVIVPPVAVVANDLGVAITVEQAALVLYNLIHQMFPSVAAQSTITSSDIFEDEAPMTN